MIFCVSFVILVFCMLLKENCRFKVRNTEFGRQFFKGKTASVRSVESPVRTGMRSSTLITRSHTGKCHPEGEEAHPNGRANDEEFPTSAQHHFCPKNPRK
jgi:hypothetical protein